MEMGAIDLLILLAIIHMTIFQKFLPLEQEALCCFMRAVQSVGVGVIVPLCAHETIARIMAITS